MKACVWSSRGRDQAKRTIHAAKGLEFPAVFIPGCEEGMLPFTFFGEPTPKEREEERRLLYVAMTRTRRYLFLSHAKQRLFRNKMLRQEKSSFLREIEKELFDQSTITSRPPDTQLHLF